MTDESSESPGTLPRMGLVLLLLLAGGLVLAVLTRISIAWIAALYTVITEGGMAALILIAAGGYAYPVVRRLAPPSAPGGLVVLTACGLGLWMLGTLLLIVGSLIPGSLTPWLWWPVIALGVLLAAWLGRKRMEGWRIPERLDGRALVWVLVALAVGFWLAGATRPPGWWIGVLDEYDVLEYHLQVPREWYNAGRISPLKHNAYSYYPLGTEMLFLLAMSLRKGAYEGMYLAKLIHGGFAVLAVAAVFASLKRDQDTRARFSAALLATTPFVVYLSWLAMVELAVVFYLTLGVLWLREWIREGSVRSAWCIGLALGGACAVKYLSVGFVVAPILAVMLGLSGRGGRRLSHAGPVLLMTGIVFSPWLIRNTIHTGNPVFPLATRLFGAGHWSGESEQRWVDGHGPRDLPPVPRPAGWEDPARETRLERFYKHFMGVHGSQWFGTLMMMTAGVSLCVLLASGTRGDPWDWGLVGVAGVQLVVWSAFTHGMPTRFLMPIIVPLTLLAGRALGRLAAVKVSPFRRRGPSSQAGPWGRPPAVVIFVAAAAVNLITVYAIYKRHTGIEDPQTQEFLEMERYHGVPGREFAKGVLPWRIAHELPASSRILLVGEAKGFYFPAGTVYATVFDEHPLAEMTRQGLSAGQILERLRRRKIHYIWVDWGELWRLANTYGCAEPFSKDLFARWQAGRQPGLEALEKLKPAGLKLVIELGFFPAGPYWDPDKPRLKWPRMALYALPGAPVTTLPTTLPATQPADAGDG